MRVVSVAKLEYMHVNHLHIPTLSASPKPAPTMSKERLVRPARRQRRLEATTCL
jgi:hypothetical protein